MENKTIIKSASVKVMQSFNYNHFEASLVIENEEGLDLTEVDEAIKYCQRLTDKAVGQYQKAKDMAPKIVNSRWAKEQFFGKN